MYDPNNPTMPQNDMTPAEARLDIKMFLAGGPKTPYYDRWHPLHDEAIAAVNKLHRLAEADTTQSDGTPISRPSAVIDDRVGGLLPTNGIQLHDPNTVLAVQAGLERYEKEQAARKNERENVSNGSYFSGSQSNWAGNNNYERRRK